MLQQTTHHRGPRTRPSRRGTRGAGLVEYALMVTLIALVCFTALSFFGVQNDDSLDKSSSKLAEVN